MSPFTLPTAFVTSSPPCEAPPSRRSTASPEPVAGLEARIAALLPGLFLARVDGKSPVEYIVDDAMRDAVRRVARPLVAEPPTNLSTIRAAWAAETASWSRHP